MRVLESMSLDEYFTFVAPDDIRIQDTRVGIETVLYEYVHRRESPERIAERYPSLTLEQVYATITYYLRNKAAMDDYLSRWLEHARHMREAQEHHLPPVVARLRQVASQRKPARTTTGA
jgi:uncharacterized protein (DUF433 family)